MADDLFSIEWEGLDEFVNELEVMAENAEKIIMEEYTKFGMLAEEGAKALAPHDHGDLSDSINFKPATKEGNNIVVRGGSNLIYALRRHEEPYRMGVHDKYDRGRKYPDYYVGGKGRGTHNKPSWRGYKPGRKYLENAINAIMDDFDEMNERTLTRILEVKP